MIQKTENFFNKVAADIRQKYFANEVHGKTENENYNKTTYTIELFNNGVTSYSVFVARLAKYCNDTKANIHFITKKYIDSFDEYKYNPSEA